MYILINTCIMKQIYLKTLDAYGIGKTLEKEA